MENIRQYFSGLAFLVIMMFEIAFLTLAIGISAGVFHTMISRLRAEISSSKSEALEVSLN